MERIYAIRELTYLRVIMHKHTHERTHAHTHTYTHAPTQESERRHFREGLKSVEETHTQCVSESLEVPHTHSEKHIFRVSKVPLGLQAQLNHIFLFNYTAKQKKTAVQLVF